MRAWSCAASLKPKAVFATNAELDDAATDADVDNDVVDNVLVTNVINVKGVFTV